MNQTTEFLADQNASYLSGKAIERILEGDLKEAQELLKREEKRLEKLPKPAPVVDFPPVTHVKKSCKDLDSTAHVCEQCVKKDYRDELPFDYKITVTDKGTCDACGGHDLQLTSILKVQADAEKDEKKTPFVFASNAEN